MSSTRSRSGRPIQPRVYEGFMGIDDSRDITAMETGEQQHLVKLNNGFCDWRGQITRDPPIKKRAGQFPVRHARWFAPDLLCWAEERGDGVHFNSDLEHAAPAGWPNGVTVSSTVFNRRAHFFSRQLQPYYYDGANWRPNGSNALTFFRPAFAAAVNRRMCVAGMVGRETIVDISRVDNDEVFSDDEPVDSANVLRAGFIDVGNLLGTADQITGLGSFEQDRLAIFTQDRCLVYRIDPDINNWALEPRVNIHVGCASHNSIVQAGTDILFCSRAGVHSVARSADNGITVFSQPMSDKVERTYRSLFRQVSNPQDISAVWDRDQRQYRIYFPLASGETRTLVMTLGTAEQRAEVGQTLSIQTPKWSTASGFNVMGGAALGGRVVVATRGGVYDMLENDDEEGETPEMTFCTPVLWNGDLDKDKQSLAIVLSASGKGTIEMLAYDDSGRSLGSHSLEIEQEDDDDSFPDVALRRQYRVKFERRYRGLQLHFRVQGKGLIRISGIALIMAKE